MRKITITRQKGRWENHLSLAHFDNGEMFAALDHKKRKITLMDDIPFEGEESRLTVENFISFGEALKTFNW